MGNSRSLTLKVPGVYSSSRFFVVLKDGTPELIFFTNAKPMENLDCSVDDGRLSRLMEKLDESADSL